MKGYFLRRILYMVPILLGVNLLTFILFFGINTPEEMARSHLGGKRLTPEAVQSWIVNHDYDYPRFWNFEKTGVEQVTQTLFFQKSLKVFLFDFGLSDAGQPIGQEIKERMFPSLALAIPTLICSILFNLACALILLLFLNTYLDFYGVMFCLLLLSISSLFYIVVGQAVFAKSLLLFPISGYTPGWGSIKFLILPVVLGVLANVGAGVRWYRALFVEEWHKEYVRNARSKGLGEWKILWTHVLPNAILPILTSVVAILPLLFLGSLLFESFFGIPGLGSYTLEALEQQDFSVVRAIVFLGTVLYLIGLLLTDVSYIWADPRVRLS